MLEVPPGTTQSLTLSQLALQLAVEAIGVHETPGQANRGPEVDEYLRAVGLDPAGAYPWCAAFLYSMFKNAAAQLGLVNPLPKTASTLRLWKMAEPVCRDANPAAGYVYVLKHSEASGHVGIIESVDPATGLITEVSANTNEAGSREGNAVVRKTGRSPEAIHHGELLGYLSFDRAAQQPPPRAA